MSKTRMPMRGISLWALAKELNVDTCDIVRLCQVNDLSSDQWTEWSRGGRTHFRGPVSLGLAETIRNWHREGLFRHHRTAAEYDDDLVVRAAAYGHRANSFAIGFGAELDAIINSMREAGVDLTTDRARTLIWRAWKGVGGDWERWVECWNCGGKYRPVVNRKFVLDYIDLFQSPSGGRGAGANRPFLCVECKKKRSCR